MPSRTASVRSLALAVAAIGTVAATVQAAPKTAAPTPAAAQPAAPTPAQPSEAAGSPAATVAFDRQSVEINAAARGALDTLAQVLRAQGVRQVELRGYATGEDADDARKLALVRTLAVRMYLIDQGVRARIEVMAQAAPAKGGTKERVDVMTP
ncbi:MAG TPA: OmpA family protein [Reyranella sp.]|jgi:outer membrane protein OmpA-like peptidoglycan-associated protein